MFIVLKSLCCSKNFFLRFKDTSKSMYLNHIVFIMFKEFYFFEEHQHLFFHMLSEIIDMIYFISSRIYFTNRDSDDFGIFTCIIRSIEDTDRSCLDDTSWKCGIGYQEEYITRISIFW